MAVETDTVSGDRRWLPRGEDADDAAAAAELVRELGLPEPLCRILIRRGHADADSAKRFLRPSISDLEDPHALAGMEEAAERICRAIDDGETVLVHGDYDVDGMCAAALYTRVLRALGAAVVPFVPHRTRDGYDLGEAGVRAALDAGATLLVSADCGVLAHAAVRRAREAGVDVVVTDHHAPGETLPECVAVIDPGRSDCGYPNKGLSGTGVAFKLCQALWAARGRDPDDLLYYLDLVALATVADLMPLEGENRVMVSYGLRVLRESRNPGLRALLARSGLEERESITAGQLGYVLGPRLNAVGRLADAATGVQLLLADSAAAAAPLAELLESENLRRREVDRRTLAEALERLGAVAPEGGEPTERALVVAGAGWHPGVIGIVASRLVDRFARPAIVIALDPDGGAARGSGRSVAGFDLVAALRECGGHLVRFGGHAMAAGLDLLPGELAAFTARFQAVARERIPPEALTPVTRYDLEIELEHASAELCGRLRHLGPFGVGNPAPVFRSRELTLGGAPRVVGGEHLRLDLRHGGSGIGAIGFGMAGRAAEIGSATRLEALYQLQENVWRGRRRPEAKLVDIRAER